MFSNYSSSDWRLFIIQGLLVFAVSGLMYWLAKRKNKKDGYDTEKMDVDHITRAWLKGALMSNQMMGFYVLLGLLLALSLGLVCASLGYLLLGLFFMIGALFAMAIVAVKTSKGKLSVLGLDENTFQAVTEYFLANKSQLIEEVSKDPEVLAVFNSWSSWDQKINIWLRNRKSFKPVRGPQDAW
mgnify:CR=1 FL=1